MDTVWPSAGRAWELLNGLVDLRDVDLARPPGHPDAVRGVSKRGYPDDSNDASGQDLASHVSSDHRYLMGDREDSLSGASVWDMHTPGLHANAQNSDPAWASSGMGMERHVQGDRSIGMNRSSEDLHSQITPGGYGMKHPSHPMSTSFPSANGSGRQLSYGSPDSMANVFPPFSPPRSSSFWNDQMAMPFSDPTLASAFMGLPVNLSHISDFSSDVRGDGLFMQPLATDRQGTPEGDVPTSYHLLNRDRSSNQFSGGM